MRPTSLRFRSPKERTAEFNDPQVTYDGRKAKFPSIKSAKSTFSKERRFMQYFFDQKKTNVVLGPGTYDAPRNVSAMLKKPCAVLYVFLFVT